MNGNICYHEKEVVPSDPIVEKGRVLSWATATTGITHIAITGALNGKNVEWMEKVTDEQYRR